jgi:hypothetical protein
MPYAMPSMTSYGRLSVNIAHMLNNPSKPIEPTIQIVGFFYASIVPACVNIISREHLYNRVKRIIITDWRDGACCW